MVHGKNHNLNLSTLNHSVCLMQLPIEFTHTLSMIIAQSHITLSQREWLGHVLFLIHSHFPRHQPTSEASKNHVIVVVIFLFDFLQHPRSLASHHHPKQVIPTPTNRLNPFPPTPSSATTHLLIAFFLPPQCTLTLPFHVGVPFPPSLF